MASYPALDLRWAAGPGAGTLQDFLYAELDAFEPVAIHDHETADGWRVFFRTAGDRDAACTALSAEFGSTLLELSSKEIDDEDWARRSQAELRAVRVGGIVIAPPWDVPSSADRDPLSVDRRPLSVDRDQLAVDADPLAVRRDSMSDLRAASPGPRPTGEIVIVITPSMGFGTGHHATTRLCLELVQEIDVLGQRVIDVGTGSGVLAIAAARLGAASVLAVDNDPDAIQNARENVDANGVAGVVDVRLADLEEVDQPADVLFANLTGATLVAHAEHLQRWATPGAIAIISGFGPDESHAIASGWTGWSVLQRKREGDWAAVCLVLRRQSQGWLRA